MTDDDQLVMPDDAEQRFAANLPLLRERQGISQVKLAQEMAARGWPWRQQTVTRVENGQRMIRFGEAMALASILGVSLNRFTRPVSEVIEVEKIRAASARLRESCDVVVAAVCRLLEERRTAERLQVLDAQVQGDDFVEVALVPLRMQMKECTVDNAILEGRLRFAELGENRDAEGEAAGPAPETTGEPAPRPDDQVEAIGAPSHVGGA